MLMRSDPCWESDRLAQQVTGATQGTWSRPTALLTNFIDNVNQTDIDIPTVNSADTPI
jgi:hypothetical protein